MAPYERESTAVKQPGNHTNSAGKLFCNTAAFACAFAMWVMLGPSARLIAAELGIAESAATALKATPILLGALLRVPVGILADRLGARVVFPAVILLASLGALGLSFAQTMFQLTAAALLMGLIGTTFAVGVQSVSSWSSPDKQGFALGVFGAGNVGTAITTLCMPWLLRELGWRSTFRLYTAALVVVALVYFAVMRNAPRRGAAPTLSALLQPLTEIRAWRFGLYYVASFGTFVATTLLITDVYVESFGMSLPSAGLAATSFTFAASLARIPGGRLSDQYGAHRVLEASLMVIACSLLATSMQLPMLPTATLFLMAAIAMGFGMAATYRYIPDAYPTRVGAVGGIVGALGGLGGFVLPFLCQPVKADLGFSQAQALPIAGAAALAFIVLRVTESPARSAEQVAVSRIR